MASSSPWVKNLKVMSFLAVGKVKENSFLSSTTKDSSNCLSFILAKSIEIYSLPYSNV